MFRTLDTDVLMPDITDPNHVSQAIRFLSGHSSQFRELIAAVGEFTLQPTRGGYRMLVRSILSQQISTAAARTIHRRLQEQLPGGRVTPKAVDALSDADLARVGISQQKQSYLRDLTERTLSQSIRFDRFRRRDDESIIEELIQVRGIGRWTAQMFLIFSLGRIDVFAPDDLGLRNAALQLFQLPPTTSRQQLNDLASQWAPYRTVASWYLWRSLELRPDEVDRRR